MSLTGTPAVQALPELPASLLGESPMWHPGEQVLYWCDLPGRRLHPYDPAHERFDDGKADPRDAARAALYRGPALSAYGGRPDGAAMDAEGGYWVAMFEGACLLRIAADGRTTDEVPLPVRCRTMPCFGGSDLRTLHITTSRERRPDDELAREPLAGCVLQARTEVPGLPVHFVQL